MEDKVEFAVRLQLVPVKQVDAHEPATTVLKANAAGELLDFKGFKFIRKRPAQQVEAPASANKRAAASHDATPEPKMQVDHTAAIDDGNAMEAEDDDDGVQQEDIEPEEQYQEEEDEQLHEQLLECLPASCPLVTRLSLLVSHLLQQPVASKPRSAANHLDGNEVAAEGEVLSTACDLLAQRFCQLLTQQVTLARGLLIQQATNAQPSAAPEASHQIADPEQPVGPAKYEDLAPAIRAAAEGPDLQASLHNSLAALHAEEALWRELAQQYSQHNSSAAVTEPAAEGKDGQAVDDAQADGVEQLASHADGTTDIGSPVQGLLRSEPTGCAAECPATPSAAADDVLGQAVESAHDEMVVKVDAVSGQVATVQVLLRRARQAAAGLQAQHFMDKFAGLAHVNTPQALIRNISSMPAATAAGIMAAATPVVTPQGTPLHA